ncbi:MAG: tetratricopeptide repeat protein [Ferruginibacter sp.]
MKILPLFLLTIVSSGLYAQKNDSSRFYFNKGIEEKNARHFLVASQAFEKAIKFDPAYTEAYMENGYVFLEMRKTDPAIRNFTRVYELQPANKIVVKELMDLYYNYRQYNKATEFAYKCIDCKGAQRIIGMSYYRQEDYMKAEKALLSALSKDGDDAEVTYTLARTYLDMEEYKKAVPYYEKAVSMDKTKNVWMYELGLLYFNLTNYKGAVSSFNTAVERGYTVSNDLNENLGYASLYSGEYDKGENLLLNIWSKKPGNKDILRDMAEVLYQQKQYDRSLVYCQKLMELDPNDAKALYQGGLNFQKKGNKDRGQQMCDKAIEMDPSLASLRREKKMPGL